MSLDRLVLPRSDVHKVPPQTLKRGSPPRQEYHPTYHTISLCPRYCKEQKNKLLLDSGAGSGETVVVSRVLKACLEPSVDLLLLPHIFKSCITKIKS